MGSPGQSDGVALPARVDPPPVEDHQQDGRQGRRHVA